MLVVHGYLWLDTLLYDKEHPNIIIVVADALRSDHMGCYGYARPTTPNIDAFAKESRLYLNAFTQSPSTKPSIASLFTSLYPIQHQVIYNDNMLPPRLTTLAEILNNNNFRTAGFIENPVLTEAFNYQQGFDVWHYDGNRFSNLGMNSELDGHIYHWLSRRDNLPFFMYIHYFDPHDPYRAPDPFYHKFSSPKKDLEIDATISRELNRHKEYIKQHSSELQNIIDHYDDEIAYIDSRFQTLVDTLRHMGIYDSTIIIFLSDHGEGFLDHEYFFHSYSVYSELINMPLIIHYPDWLPRGIDETHVQHVDLMPTLLQYLNIYNPTLIQSGRNINETASSHDLIISEHLRLEGMDPQTCMIDGEYKLIKNIDSNTYELYHLTVDPTDQHNCINRHTALADSLIRKMKAYTDELLGRQQEAKRTKLDEEMIRRLKSLGYM